MYWWLLPIAVIGIGFMEVFIALATREKKFKELARVKILQSSYGAFTKITIGILMHGNVIGLILGYLLTQVSGLFKLVSIVNKEILNKVKIVTLRKAYFYMRMYKDFPKFQVVSEFLMTISVKAPLIIIASIYGQEEAGYFALAVALMLLPVNLIARAMGQVYYAEIATLGIGKAKYILEKTLNLTYKIFFLKYAYCFYIV